MAIQDIIDGPVNTVLVLEVSAERAITWTQPDDYDVVPENPTDGLISADAVGFRAALADGKIRVIESSMDVETLKALFTSNGGEIIQPWSN